MKRQELLEALKVLMPCVDKQATALGGQTIGFAGKRLVAYNLSMGGVYNLDTPVQLAMDAKQLKGFVDSFTGDDITFETKEKVTMKCGKSRVTLPFYNATIHDRLLNMDTTDLVWKPIPENYLSILYDGVLPAGADKEAKNLQHVYVSGSSVYSTNRAVIYHSTFDGNFKEHLIPMRFIPELAKHKFTHCAVDRRFVFFKNDKYMMLCHTADESLYPAASMEAIVKGYQEAEAVVEGELPEIIDQVRVSSLTDNEEVSLQFEVDGVVVSTKGITGEFSTKVDGFFKTETDANFKLTSRMLSWLLKQAVDKVYVKAGPQGTGLVFTGIDSLYLMLV